MFSDLKGGDFLYKICNKKITKEEVCSTYKYQSGMIYTILMCDLPFEAPESESVFKVKKSTHYYYYVINKEDIAKYQLIIAKEKLNEMVGYSDHACEECSKYKDTAVYFIEIDSEKSVGNDTYRTGRITGIRKESELVAAAEKYIITLEDGTRFCYIDKKEGKRIGMWND